MFGLQLEQLERQYHTPEIFREIFRRMGEKPAYVTNYNYAMNAGISDEDLEKELLLIAECGGYLIDIMGDMFCREADQITYDEDAIEKQKQLIDKLHAMGKEVLISTHTYRFMEYDDVYRIVHAHKERGADVAKIVTASGNETEEKENFEISARLSKELGLPFLFLCVGEKCKRHRKVGPLISGGMFLCVVEHDNLSTAAQPLLEDVITLLNTIYESEEV